MKNKIIMLFCVLSTFFSSNVYADKMFKYKIPRFSISGYYDQTHYFGAPQIKKGSEVEKVAIDTIKELEKGENKITKEMLKNFDKDRYWEHSRLLQHELIYSYLEIGGYNENILKEYERVYKVHLKNREKINKSCKCLSGSANVFHSSSDKDQFFYLLKKVREEMVKYPQ